MSDTTKANWAEVQVWARLLATFHADHGRDPNDRESLTMLRAARLIAAATTVH